MSEAHSDKPVLEYSRTIDTFGRPIMIHATTNYWEAADGEAKALRAERDKQAREDFRKFTTPKRRWR